eukprot:scaffold11142_cov37-Attheya_sp.AAC.4
MRVGVLLVPNPEDDVDDLETVPNPENEEEAPPNPVDPKTDGVAKEKLLPKRGLLAVGVEEEDSDVCLLASMANGFWVMPKESVGLDT